MISMYDVLLAMSNIPVDDPIAEIWGRQMQGGQGGHKVVEYTGALPITISANGDALLDYRIYGASGGVGAATENLVDFEAWLVREGVPYIKDGNSYTIPGLLNKLYSNPYYFSDTDIYVSISGVITIPTGSNIRIYIVKRDGTISGSTALGGNDGIRRRQNVLGAGIKFDYASIGSCTVDRLMLNSGATACPYEPYGYKLPMTVQSANLWENNSFWDTGALLSGEQLFGKSYSVQPGTYTISTDVIDNADTTIASVFALAATQAPETAYSNVDGVFQNRPRTLTVSEGEKLWICIRNVSIQGYLAWNKKSFASYWIMASKGSTVLPYQPYSRTDTPVYIGENQLDSNEYVSYGEQKIYRDVGGTLTPIDPPVPLPEIPTIGGTTVIDYDEDPKPSQMYVKYKGAQ